MHAYLTTLSEQAQMAYYRLQATIYLAADDPPATPSDPTPGIIGWVKDNLLELAVIAGGIFVIVHGMKGEKKKGWGLMALVVVAVVVVAAWKAIGDLFGRVINNF